MNENITLNGHIIKHFNKCQESLWYALVAQLVLGTYQTGEHRFQRQVWSSLFILV
jgi:hypothetical protein